MVTGADTRSSRVAAQLEESHLERRTTEDPPCDFVRAVELCARDWSVDVESPYEPVVGNTSNLGNLEFPRAHWRTQLGELIGEQ